MFLEFIFTIILELKQLVNYLISQSNDHNCKMFLSLLIFIQTKYVEKCKGGPLSSDVTYVSGQLEVELHESQIRSGR